MSQLPIGACGGAGRGPGGGLRMELKEGNANRDRACLTRSEDAEERGQGGEASSHMAHGKKVVEAALAAGGEAALERLVMRFRRAFVEYLQPRHLPAAWNVHHFARREFGEYSVYVAGGSG